MEDQKYIIRDASPGDGAEIARIYNYYIANTIITFEEDAVSADTIRGRMDEVREAGFPWLVAEQNDTILGYAYGCKWKERSAYRHSTEVAVYIAQGHIGKGIGSALFGKLLPALKSAGAHVAVSGISLPNEASIRLHAKMGFVKVAHFQEVGFKHNRWIDVGFWQLIL